MVDLEARNGRHALFAVANAVLRHGEEVAPRGQRTKELRHFSLEVADPYDVLCTGIGANQSSEVAASEALQLIGGFSDPEFSVLHAPNLAAFRNGTGGFDGAYGPRLEPLLYDLCQRLVDDRNTRQAILPIWRADDVLRWGSKDYPCTLTLGFFIRADKLELDVTMRSNDVNWGLKNDMFQFTQLQLSVAHLLNLEAGPYRHTALSMHVYERDWGWAEALDAGNLWAPIPDHPRGIDGAQTVLELMLRARQVALVRELALTTTPSETWYRKVLGYGT